MEAKEKTRKLGFVPSSDVTEVFKTKRTRLRRSGFTGSLNDEGELRMDQQFSNQYLILDSIHLPLGFSNELAPDLGPAYIRLTPGEKLLSYFVADVVAVSIKTFARILRI